MGPGGGIVSFAVIWMVSLFMVLPWGMRSHTEAGAEIVPGSEASAPVRPRLLLKFAITTGVALVLWGALYATITYRLLSLDDFPF